MIKKIKSNFVKTICTGILDRRPPSVWFDYSHKICYLERVHQDA
jgi:hypothetical protein